MKAYINGSVTGYDIDKGWTYTKNANETLDSAVIRISHVGKLDIQPFDNVEIKKKTSSNPDTYETYVYLCVDSYQEQQISLDPVIYNYEIHLCSEIKKFENIILPNISITPFKLTRQWTIKEVILYKIWAVYIPRYRNGNLKYSTPVLPDAFNKVCPELQWTTPTLRQVLNDLYMLCDCIPTMQNNVMGYLDLTRTGNRITNFNFITRSRSSQDYASEIKMNLQNTLQEKYTTKTYEYLTFTCNDFILTTDNLMLETQYPILRINHLWMNLPISEPLYVLTGDEGQLHSKFARVDLCNLRFKNDSEYSSIVKEKKEYDILNVVKYVKDETFNNSSIVPYANCKNTCLYYTRGGNKIYGFSNTYKISQLQTEQLVKLVVLMGYWSYLKDNLNNIELYDNFPTYGTIFGNFAYDWFTPTFEIEYETTKEVVFSAGKKEVLRNERTIMDNQTNAWVNAEAQGNLEYQKANRIGNEVVLINQRVESDETPIDIFDKLDDEIVYRVEYQIYDNYSDVNAYATKNYILRDYYTGINSKIRTWVNAQDEAFIRHDLFKYYVEIGENTIYEDTSLALFRNKSTNLKINQAISCLKPGDYHPVKSCFVETYDDDIFETGTLDWDSNAFSLNIIKRVIGNSIVLTWGFNDNYVALKMPKFGDHTSPATETNDDGIIADNDYYDYIGTHPVGFTDGNDDYYTNVVNFPTIKENRIDDLGGIPLQPYQYCDKQGYFEIIYTGFCGDLTETGEITKTKYLDNIKNQKRGQVTSDIFHIQALLVKDNKEIITNSLQIEYINLNDNIYVYDNFYKLNELINVSAISALQVYGGSNDIMPVTPLSSGLYTLNVTNNNDYSATLTLTTTGLNYDYYWICSGSTPLLRLYKTKVVNFNLLLKRDKEGLS